MKKQMLQSAVALATMFACSASFAENYFADCRDATQTLQDFMVNHCKALATTSARKYLFDFRKVDPTTLASHDRGEDFNDYEWQGVMDNLREAGKMGPSIGCQAGPYVLPLNSSSMSFNVASCEATDSQHQIHYKISTQPITKFAILTAFQPGPDGQEVRAEGFDQTFSFIDSSSVYHIVHGPTVTVRDPGRGCQFIREQKRYFVPMERQATFQIFLIEDKAQGEEGRLYENLADGNRFGWRSRVSSHLLDAMMMIGNKAPAENQRQADCKVRDELKR